MFILIFFLLFAANSPGEETVTLQQVDSNLDEAASMSITPRGWIYVAEKQRHRFLVYNNQGIRSDSLGAQGWGDYRFDSPVSIEATNGLKVYVSDLNNNRVQLYDRRHQYLSSINAEKVNRPGQFTPARISVNGSNELFIYDSSRHVIYMFDINGNFSRELDLRPYRVDSVTGISFLNSVLLLLDSENGLIHRFDSSGGYLNFIGGFNGALSVRGYRDHIWAAFPDRISQLTERGTLLKNFQLESAYPFTDISVHENMIYLLTADALYKTPVK